MLFQIRVWILLSTFFFIVEISIQQQIYIITIMGNSTSLQPIHPNLNPNHWMKVNSSDKPNYISIHDQTLVLEQHLFSIDEETQLETFNSMIKLRRHSPDLVSVEDVKVQEEGQMCSNLLNGSLMIEKIPITLADVKDIPFPDILHVYHQCLSGFHKLIQQYGHFQINEDSIGINYKGIVKVWHSYLSDKITPISIPSSQSKMLTEIISLIHKHTNHQTLLPMGSSIPQFLYRNTNLRFHEAQQKIRLYAKTYNRSHIPEKLFCSGYHAIISRTQTTTNHHPPTTHVQSTSNYQLSKPMTTTRPAQSKNSLAPIIRPLSRPQNKTITEHRRVIPNIEEQKVKPLIERHSNFSEQVREFCRQLNEQKSQAKIQKKLNPFEAKQVSSGYNTSSYAWKSFGNYGAIEQRDKKTRIIKQQHPIKELRGVELKESILEEYYVNQDPQLLDFQGKVGIKVD